MTRKAHEKINFQTLPSKIEDILIGIIKKGNTYGDKIFLALISGVFFAYTLAFLHQGYNASDEGYLIAQGYRVTLGQVPYKDFYYARTPLPIFIHAFLITLFGESHTLYFLRIYWSVQTWGSLVLSYYILRRLYSPAKSALFVTPAIFFPSLIANFPWYTYDGVFFLLLAFYFMIKGEFTNRKGLVISGFFIGLAFLSKQTFIVMFPLLFVLCLLNFIWNKRFKSSLRPTFSFFPPVFLGFFAVFGVFLFYLLVVGAVNDFFYNCFVLPREIKETDLSLQWFLFQNLPKKLVRYRISGVSFVLFLLLLVSFRARFATRINVGIAAVILVAVNIYNFQKYDTTTATHFFVYIVLVFNYFVLVSALLVTYSGLMKKRSRDSEKIIPFLFFAISLQYLASFNYGGIIFSNVGTFLSLPFSLIVFHDRVLTIRIPNVSGFPPVNKSCLPESKISKKRIVYVFMLSLIIVNTAIHYEYVYRDYPRDELTYEFNTPALKKIHSHRENVEGIDNLVKYIKNETENGDYIFIFPNYPILYYLTRTENPTMLDFYYTCDFNEKIAKEAVEDLKEHRPKFVVLQKYDVFTIHYNVPFDYENTTKFSIIYTYILNEFELVEDISTFYIYK